MSLLYNVADSARSREGEMKSMLKDELARHLREKILPFWERLADPVNGGYYGWMDRELRVNPAAHKGCILNARILWSFATAARVTGEERYREDARRALDFLSRFEDGERGGVYWSVTAEGQPLDTTKHTYCQAFVIYGLAAWYRLTGDENALQRAMDLFDVIEKRCRDAGGYGEAYQADFSPESNEKLSENGVMASRTMNTLLHVLEAYAELYRARPSERVRQAGVEALERFLKVMYNPAKHRLEVFYDADYRSLLDMQSYGHDIEASWLIWDAAETLLPPEARGPWREMCLDLARSVYERAFTDHGLRNECVDGVNDETRIWWVQAETLLGLDNARRLTGEPMWEKAMETQWNTIQRMIVDPRPLGEWYWSVHEDGSLTGRPMVEEWKCPYHNSRMCLRLMELGE